MKTILFLFPFLFSLELIAQIDTSIVKILNDEMTGRKSILSKTLILENEVNQALTIYAMKSDNNKVVIICIHDISGNIKCVDENNKVNILFVDGSRMELYNNSDFNCQSKSVLYFRSLFGRGAKLDELKSKLISQVRIWGMGNYSEAKFDKEQGENFMKALQIIDSYKF